MSKKYKNPPLVEALSELNFAPETSQDFDSNRKSVATLVSGKSGHKAALHLKFWVWFYKI